MICLINPASCFRAHSLIGLNEDNDDVNGKSNEKVNSSQIIYIV